MTSTSEKSSVRIWMDGCFDLVHCGHADACRQAKAMGTYLIVGAHTDAEIKKHKGQPVTLECERYKLLKSIKWIDEVVEGAPYVPTLETLNKHNCDFCVHGEELAVGIDGTDYHEPVKRAGRYKDLIRQCDISTTNLIQRILSRKINVQVNDGEQSIHDTISEHVSPCPTIFSAKRSSSRILMETLDQFLLGYHEPKATHRIIFAPGTYDLFHTGHLDFLEQAKLLGDYLLVGVYSDENSKIAEDHEWPIMTMYERALSLAACRLVDNVIVDAPYEITEHFINQHKIYMVIHGLFKDECDVERFKIPKKLGKFKILNSGNSMTSKEIVRRVLDKRSEYQARNKKKFENECKGYEQFHKRRES